MKTFLLLILSLTLCSCAHKSSKAPIITNLGGISAQVGVAKTRVVTIKEKVDKLVETGAKPNDPVVISLQADAESLRASLDHALGLTVAKQEEINTLAVANQETLDRVTKDNVELREGIAKRNLFVIGAIFVGAIVFYLGTLAKLAYPPLMFAPDIVVGLLAVMAFVIVTAIIISVWSWLGWLRHLF